MVIARRVSEQGLEKDEERVDICQGSRKTACMIQKQLSGAGKS